MNENKPLSERVHGTEFRDYGGELRPDLLAPEIAALEQQRDALLAALKELMEDTQHRDHDCGDYDCPVKRARAAIAAVTGEQP